MRKIFGNDLEQNIILVVSGVNYEEGDAWLDESRYGLENVFGTIPMTTVDLPAVSSNEKREELNMEAGVVSLTRFDIFLLHIAKRWIFVNNDGSKGVAKTTNKIQYNLLS